METQKKGNVRATAIGLFGLAVIASGIWRFVSAEGGQIGLIYGLSMGSIALCSASAFLIRHELSAQLSAWASLLFIGGWFSYESFIKKGLAEAESRQLFIIGLSVATAIVLVVFTIRRSNETTSPESASPETTRQSSAD